MTARFLVGDVRKRMAELPDASFDLILCSPPFLALRSYLPDGHPDKALEIGSEATPAEYLDVLLALTAEWGRLLAPHGSIAIELGDTYAGSGGAGGDYNPNGLRDGQPRFRMPPTSPENAYPTPLEKSLMGIPALYQIALAYGINPLTGRPSPAGRWRVRNLKAWIRSNPPVGALGDKERPATSYIIVACRARDRWFDLDAVRTPFAPTWVGEDMQRKGQGGGPKSVEREAAGVDGQGRSSIRKMTHEGAPPRDWWHHTDAVLQTELDRRNHLAGHPNGGKTADGKRLDKPDGARKLPPVEGGRTLQGAQGHHLRRALETAGILPTPPDVHDISPKGYAGAHYAVWPPELVRQLVDEMCPRRVCLTCGEPSRRITQAPTELHERHAAFAETLRVHRKAAGLSQPDVDALFGFNGMCSHWERRINGPQSQPSYPSPEQWRSLRSELAIATDEFDGLIDGYRRWAERDLDPEYRDAIERTRAQGFYADTGNDGMARVGVNGRSITSGHRTLGWSDCGHNTWRPGRVLDPFVGSGTTLAVTTGMARDAVGIDIDPRNALLAAQRVGMFLEVDDPTPPPIDVVETL